MAEQRPVDIQEVPASLARLRGLDLEPIAQPHGGEPTDPLVTQISASKPVLVMAGLGAAPQENIGEVVERHALAGVADFDGVCLGIPLVEAVPEILAILGRIEFRKPADGWQDRKSGGSGKSVSVSVGLGGRRMIKKK